MLLERSGQVKKSIFLYLIRIYKFLMNNWTYLYVVYLNNLRCSFAGIDSYLIVISVPFSEFTNRIK